MSRTRARKPVKFCRGGSEARSFSAWLAWLGARMTWNPGQKDKAEGACHSYPLLLPCSSPTPPAERGPAAGRAPLAGPASPLLVPNSLLSVLLGVDSPLSVLLVLDSPPPPGSCSSPPATPSPQGDFPSLPTPIPLVVSPALFFSPSLNLSTALNLNELTTLIGLFVLTSC